MASAAQAKDFIKRIAPIIQKEAKARGYKVCSPIIAQACIESAFDGSVLAYKYHNYFGMKCGSSWKGRSVNLRTKEEYTVGQLTTIRDNFRAYQTMEDGVKGYFEFINTKRYANLKTAETPQEYLKRIKADGYATSSTYVNTNMNCISKYNLTEWDWQTPNMDKSIDEIAIEVIDGKWGVGATRKQLLRAAGYNPSMVQARVNEILKNK
ncbi:MAG: glucosaminidase domain-containing protein [Bacilli bacterium]|nr:glucosaminidase domain-containing protein [Bacilli bacterium]